MFTITTIILIVTVLVSIGAFTNQKIMNDLIFYPPAVQQGQWYRFITCGLIHADAAHLLFNMIALYSFGNMVERSFEEFYGASGKWVYLILYVSALFTSLLPTYLKNKDNHYYRSLGASGAVSAVTFAGLLLVPYSEVYFFFIPIPIPGFVFAPLYLLLSAWLERRGGDNINHSAHIWGAIYGLAFTIVAGYAVGFNVLGNFISGIQMYLRGKGLM